MYSRFPVLLLLTVCFSLAQADSGQLQDVVDRIVRAYGGEENLGKLNKMTQEWDIFALMGNRHGTDVRNIQIPGRLKVELTYPDKSETRVLNGDVGWVIFDDRPAEIAQAPQRDAMRLQLMRLYSPLALRERIGALSMTAEGGLLALSLTENGLRVDYLVNQDNWRIEKVVGTLEFNGNEMRFLTEYSDFEFVEGVLLHHRENKYAGNVNTAVLRLRRIETDATFGDDLFKP